MTRDLRFRGQTLDDDWVYGGVGFNKEGISNFIKALYSLIEVRPDTVGQFTGLYDIKGIPIYEHDCLKLSHSTKVPIFKVIYSNSLARFLLSNFKTKEQIELTSNTIENYQAEVDGNNFDDAFRYLIMNDMR